MKVTIGNPQSPVSVEVDVEPEDGPETVGKEVRKACATLKFAFDTWKEWSLENETPQETELREINEEMSKRQVRQLKAQLQASDQASELLRQA